MNSDQWRLATDVFHAALACTPTGRPAFLDGACQADEAVRAEVERLLAAHERAGRFGDAPVFTDLPWSAPAVPAAPATAEAGPSVDDSESAVPDVASVRRRHGFIWVTAVAAIVALATFAYAAWLLVDGKGVTRDFGWQHVRQPGGWRLSQVDPEGPAAGHLEVGDRILTLNGVTPLPGGGTTLHRRGLSVGDSYDLVVERGGERIDRTLVVSAGPSTLGRDLVYFVTSLIWCSVGLFIGFARPDHRVARVASTAAVLTGIGYLTVAVIQAPSLINPLHAVVGVHFFSIFPTGRRLQGLWKWGLALGYAVAAVPVALSWWLQGGSTLRPVGRASSRGRLSGAVSRSSPHRGVDVLLGAGGHARRSRVQLSPTH